LALSHATPTSVTLTENINQSADLLGTPYPRHLVSILDGETIALGGLIREDVQKVNDKVPVLVDMPLVGRLFRSNVDQHIKKNLTIFVTVRLIDAAGQPVNSKDGYRRRGSLRSSPKLDGCKSPAHWSLIQIKPMPVIGLTGGDRHRQISALRVGCKNTSRRRFSFQRTLNRPA